MEPDKETPRLLWDKIETLEKDALSLLDTLSRLLDPSSLHAADRDEPMSTLFVQQYYETVDRMLAQIQGPSMQRGPPASHVPPANPGPLLEAMKRYSPRERAGNKMDL